MLTLVNTECCAYQPIEGLKDYDTPEAAMLAFCKQVLNSPARFRGSEICRTGSIYAFYIFSAPTGTAYLNRNKYGHKFAKLIEQEELGTVWMTDSRPNEVFHPEHENIVWVWAPVKEALRKWMKKQEGK
jgi:hypothetical protein